ncbi:alpha/beta hydrolase-fold protein [Aquimarina sp. MMG016]|uniref:alpha/beta hydrolase-fold protein n=1 Tax=Aquimarina sp. MMG016 TaxID=2822690 RepID=UPI001B39DA8D|nr:alpha/beta hydrolase-fold protein [Aquimarina sp. MMG016]MBQ4819587.1 tetratricopeptide repeat protein [Aquimarina sp. MMG016]
MKRIIAVVQVLIFMSLFSVIAQESEKLRIGTEYTITSTILKEKRSYIVSLPASYAETTKRYPVLVLSDGDYRFIYTSGLIEYLSKTHRIPETIIVAIPNTDRNRDLTPTQTAYANSSGGGEDFLNFIEKELLSEVDKKFRTNSYRILTGHSLGGLFAGYAYLSNSTFNAYIATDPSFWWDSQLLTKRINSDLVKKIKHKRMYISSADNYERNKQGVTAMRNAHELFCSTLKNYGVPYTHIKLEYFEDENHGTSAYRSLYEGLLYVYQNYDTYISENDVQLESEKVKGFNQEGKGVYLNTIKHTLYSESLGEEREYTISLPPSYQNNTAINHPVLFLLDGDYHVFSTSTTVEVMSKEGQIPEMIIVAISTHQSKVRDFSPTKSLIGYDGKDHKIAQKDSGNGKQFLKFLEKELLPEVKKKYRTKNYNVLVGHALGGTIVTEAYLDNTVFNAYLAIDPNYWWDDQYIIRKIDTSLAHEIQKKRFYLSGANSYKNTNGKIAKMRNSHEHFYARLKNQGISHSNVKFQIFEKEDHRSVSLISLYHGLEFIFKDYVLPLSRTITKNDIIDHYDTLSENLGVSFLPPENVVNMTAWAKFNGNERKEAYELFKMNIKNYPSSHTAYEMLGYAYHNDGNIQEAIIHFEECIRINPGINERIVALVKDLKLKK